MSEAGFLDYLVFSVLQGVTEFLPVSSSGHLVLYNKLFPSPLHSMSFDIFLHFATFLAIVVFFFKNIARLFTAQKNWIIFILAGTVPVGAVGVISKIYLENYLENMPLPYLSVMFLVTSVFVFLGGRKMNDSSALSPSGGRLTLRHACIIGLFQAVAVLPGVSRSGITISSALLLGIDPVTSFVFSFLLSLPAIAGAFVIDFCQNSCSLPEGNPGMLALSFFLSFAVGIVSLFLLKNTLVRKTYRYFSYYTAGLAITVLVYFFLKSGC
ncbi:MAG: undecaprenyl-diphosphate phosphatase [Candidatus Aureabacteria bacterium]|nr:undecaprenyl-diphosphate phosphatase [Candidatus Auribacterota bacterium]